ncbi:MAG: hypothetical protein ACE5EX_00730 [Phycisphaerae bacterium]
MSFGPARLAGLAVLCGVLGLSLGAGCRAGGKGGPGLFGGGRFPAVIQRVACLYDPKPWLNQDVEGDRKPEGIHYRAFLDPGTGRGVLKEGRFHIEMYAVEQDESGEATRTLVSDWIYSTDAYPRIKSEIFGLGYHIQLVWASKDIAGKDIELVTRFEDSAGNVATAGTYKKRVPVFAF